MIKPIKIADRIIGPGHPPFIIAEMSGNHNGSLERAFDIITAAKQAGVDAVKMQTYRPDTITLDSNEPDFVISGTPWEGRTLYQLYEWAHTPWEWHAPLFDHARSLGVTVFSSPFDSTAVDLLEDLGAPAYKIASFEAVDLPLIRYVAGTRKPMIISTGMANADEIEEAISAAREGGCDEIAILHCVSAYPAPATDYNLRTIADMSQRFGIVTGLSDHTLENVTAIASVALGVSIVEKHFTLDRQGGGPDDSFSLEPIELSQLCTSTRLAWEALGTVNYKCKPSESGNTQFRRSLYFVKDLKAGEEISPDAIRSVRPGYGLPPKYLESIIGSKVKIDVKACTAVTRDAVDLL